MKNEKAKIYISDLYVYPHIFVLYFFYSVYLKNLTKNTFAVRNVEQELETGIRVCQDKCDVG